MTIGAGIGLFVIGAILAFAVEERQIGALDINTLGYILMLAGLLVALLSFALAQRSRRTVSREPADREVVTERRTDRGDPAV